MAGNWKCHQNDDEDDVNQRTLYLHSGPEMELTFEVIQKLHTTLSKNVTVLKWWYKGCKPSTSHESNVHFDSTTTLNKNELIKMGLQFPFTGKYNGDSKDIAALVDLPVSDFGMQQQTEELRLLLDCLRSKTPKGHGLTSVFFQQT
ncbi:hypothetical protein CAPTEDRAFT_197523 [Capitella teleta]|uniref:Uncharacterized protein n=1 Tax=Capitella teleta TaxID=283909 RepID=R7UXS3_CAPTE|nr:hypothetical protein CAPTEDRAFT_197523 [Capitella teleta]|eukprot:ELU08206.1 hypothetical protein CAPTEDRAFT_197523 [Capitella teleta]